MVNSTSNFIPQVSRVFFAQSHKVKLSPLCNQPISISLRLSLFNSSRQVIRSISPLQASPKSNRNFHLLRQFQANTNFDLKNYPIPLDLTALLHLDIHHRAPQDFQRFPLSRSTSKNDEGLRLNCGRFPGFPIRRETSRKTRKLINLRPHFSHVASIRFDLFCASFPFDPSPSFHFMSVNFSLFRVGNDDMV
jgi:hypothetical protein